MSELDEFIEHCRTRVQQANLAYEMYGQRPHEFHAQYAVDVSRLCDALEEAEGERERLRAIADAAYDYLVWRGVEDHPQKQGRLEARRSELKAAVDGMWGHWSDYRDARGILAQDSEAEEGKP